MPQASGSIELLDVNVRTALQLTQAALPAMRDAGWGRVVNIASFVAIGAPQRTAYAAAKAALISCTRGWALELATTGITVNAVAPGPTETELFRENNGPGSDGEARYLSWVPMRRFGHADEIAADSVSSAVMIRGCRPVSETACGSQASE